MQHDTTLIAQYLSLEDVGIDQVDLCWVYFPAVCPGQGGDGGVRGLGKKKMKIMKMKVVLSHTLG